MIYWKDHNLAFFHIPRTGGISTRVLFNSLYGHGEIIKTEYLKFHEPLYKKKQFLTPDVFDSISVMTNIRNPFEYLISLYCYTQHAKPEYRMKLFYNQKTVDLVLCSDFPKFVKWYVENGLSFKDYLFINGKLPGNLYISRLETFSKDMTDKLKFKPNLIIGKYNKSNRNKYSCYYTAELIDKVYEKFKWAFENYYKRGDLLDG